jgi:hypothetical protein
VDAQGYVSNLKYFAEKGEFGIVEDSKGNVYIADGEIICMMHKARLLKKLKHPNDQHQLLKSSSTLKQQNTKLFSNIASKH